MFSLEKRQSFIQKSFEYRPKIKVETYEGLTVDFCQKIDANFIVRGLRNPADFEFEKTITQVKDDCRTSKLYSYLPLLKPPILVVAL